LPEKVHMYTFRAMMLAHRTALSRVKLGHGDIFQKPMWHKKLEIGRVFRSWGFPVDNFRRPAGAAATPPAESGQFASERHM